MNIYSVADAVTCIVEACIMFMLMETFCQRRQAISNWIYGLGVGVLAILINISNHIFNFDILNAVGMSISIFAVSFLYDAKVSVKAVISVLSLLFLGVLEVIVLFLITMVYDITVLEVMKNPDYRLLGIILSKTFSFLFINIIKLRHRKRNFYMNVSQWLLFLFIFTNSIVAVFLIFKLSYRVNVAYLYHLSILCSIGLLICTFISLYLYENLAKQANAIAEHRQYEQYVESQKKHMDEMLITQNKHRKFRHDMKNHFIALAGYFQEGECEKGLNYINNLHEQIKNEQYVKTGNTAFDFVVNSKLTTANAKKIKFDTKIQIPMDIPIEDMDLCAIFGNALDNAIEACDRIQSDNKRILISFIYEENMVVCKIENTSPQVQGLFKTHKADKKNHGWGLDNIRTVLKKYNSELITEYSNGKFTLKFLINF